VQNDLSREEEELFTKYAIQRQDERWNTADVEKIIAEKDRTKCNKLIFKLFSTQGKDGILYLKLVSFFILERKEKDIYSRKSLHIILLIFLHKKKTTVSLNAMTTDSSQ